MRRRRLILVSQAFFTLTILISTHTVSETYDPIPADLLFNPNQARNHILSPKGTRLAYFSSSGVSTLLNIINLADLEIIKTLNLGTGSVYDLHWINEYRLIYNANGKIMATNASGTENMVLVDHIYDQENLRSFHRMQKHWKGWTIVDSLPNDSENILLSGRDRYGYATLSKINSYTGKKIDIANGKKYKIHRWYADQSGNVRLAIRRKKGRVEIFSVSGSAADDLDLVPMRTGKHKWMYDGKSYIDQRVFFNAFSYSGDSIFIAENTDRDTFRLVEHSLKENKTIRLLAEDENFDIGYRGLYENNGLIFDTYRKTLAGIRYSADRPKTIWFDEEIKKLQTYLDKSKKATVNQILAWTADREKYVIHSFNERNPGTTAIYIRNENKLAIISHNQHISRDYKLNNTNYIHYLARDKHPIPAYVTYPPVNSDKKPPLVVMPHGGPWARDDYGFDRFVQYFSSRGYAVLQPQFRGSSGFGREHLLSAQKNLAGLMLDDIADGARWLIAENKVDRNRVYIFGLSYGGYAALMSSVKYADLYKAAVSYASPTNLVRQIKHFKSEDNYFAYEYWKILVGDPKKEKNALLAASPSEHIDKMLIPIIAASGELDPIVPIEQFEKFEKAIEKKKRSNIKTQTFKNEGHGFSGPSNYIYLAEQALNLFETNK